MSTPITLTARSAIVQTLRAKGPLSYGDLRQIFPSISPGHLSTHLGALRRQGRIRVQGFRGSYSYSASPPRPTTATSVWDFAARVSRSL